MPINISNAKNRDAVVALEGLMPKRDVRYLDPEGRAVATRKLLKSDVTRDLDQLMKKRKKLESVSKALVKDDPEIDIEHFGMFLADTSRVYVSQRGIVHVVEEFEVLKNPDGTVREKRQHRFPAPVDRQIYKEGRSRKTVRLQQQKAARSCQRPDVRLFVRDGEGPRQTKFAASRPGGRKRRKTDRDEPRGQILQRISRGPRKGRRLLPDTPSVEHGT
jgi:hypothetical protein